MIDRKNQCKLGWGHTNQSHPFEHECIRNKPHEGNHVCYCGAELKPKRKVRKDIT